MSHISLTYFCLGDGGEDWRGRGSCGWGCFRGPRCRACGVGGGIGSDVGVSVGAGGGGGGVGGGGSGRVG